MFFNVSEDEEHLPLWELADVVYALMRDGERMNYLIFNEKHFTIQ